MVDAEGYVSVFGVSPAPDHRCAAELEAAVGALPIAVDHVQCTIADLPVPSYPDGMRPSATVTLGGARQRGSGEHVLWTRAEHVRFREHVVEVTPRGDWLFGAWAAEVARRIPWAHGRAALEAAGLDLALRQGDTNLFRLARVNPQPVRYVVSFGRRRDPAAEVRSWQQKESRLQFKIDVDPRWTDDTYSQLASLGAVAVLDFKGTGAATDHERAHRYLPMSLIEDPAPQVAPWSEGFRRVVSFDGPIARAADIERLPVQPAAVNVKPARMGGVLEALRCVSVCAARGIRVYFGGMFEVSVGRPQLWILAALFAPQGPNDIAPIATGSGTVALAPHLTVDVEAPGFGS